MSAWMRQNVLGLVAIFIALSGTAFAATVQRNSVTSKAIRDNAVRSKDVRNKTLRVRDIADSAIADLRGPQGPPGEPGLPGPATGPAGGDLEGAYPDPSLAPFAVGTGEIAADAVTTDKVGLDALSGDDIDESSLGIVPNADQLDGLNSSDFASSADVHTPNRLALDDPSGDSVATTATLVDTGSFQVVATCLDDFVGIDIADVAVAFVDSSLQSRSTNGGSNDIEGDTNSVGVVNISQPDGTASLQSADFISVPAAGAPLSGYVSAEINDTNGGGSDCTFGASLVGG